jgi:hypothetical protein
VKSISREEHYFKNIFKGRNVKKYWSNLPCVVEVVLVSTLTLWEE